MTSQPKKITSKLLIRIFTISLFALLFGAFFSPVSQINTFAQACSAESDPNLTCAITSGNCSVFGRPQTASGRGGRTCGVKPATGGQASGGGGTNANTPAPQTTTPNANPATPGGSNADVTFFQILPFDCLFKTPKCERGLLNSVAEFLVGLAVPLAVVVIMWGGYKYFLGGFEGKLEGMKTVQAGIIGLALVLSANFLTEVTTSVFNSDTGFNSEGLEPLITAITGALTGLAIAMAILVIVWGGYKYFFGGLTGQADGLKSIQAGVTGLVVISLANFIASTTASLFANINTADQAVNIPNQISKVLTPILTQVILTLQGLAALVAVVVIVWGGYKYFFAGLPNSKSDGLDTIYKGVIGLVVTIIARPLVILVDSTIGSSNDQLTLDPAGIVYILQVFITNFLIPISGALTVFFFVLGAYQWLTAGGDSGKVKKGQDSIRNAVVGLVVVILATSFTQLIIFFFKNTNLTAPNTSNEPITEQTPRQTGGDSTTTGTSTTRPSL